MVEAEAPDTAEYRPLSQLVQVVAPVASEKVPSAQAGQAPKAGAGAKKPAKQAVHDEAPADDVVVNRPAAQSEHKLAPEPEYLPATHATHTADNSARTVPECKPGEHGEQLTPPAVA